ncbi:hypothetical protein EV702DRAFT_1190686 [Suillus placidus]|uniref:DUF6532 domain-containing protein n=1 Tax=Suillus placidus TaxID=48579 RepID=A0A9P7A712_9AGAM|nr:hypothetical protein EV702DRAFT_1190686 [Suillus placidus]
MEVIPPPIPTKIPTPMPTKYQTANSDSSDSDTHANDIVPGTPSASEALQVNTNMPQDEPKAKCPRLRWWASIQLEKLKKEEALNLQWAWEQADAEEEQHRQDSEIVKITSQCSNLRSELKTVMWPLVITEFGFTDDKTPEATSLNAALVKSLLENRKNFTYKDWKEGKGPFKADIIQKGMSKWCYEKKNSLRVKFSAYFMDASTGSMSFGIIVAILTAVEACIMEWTTGTRTETKFYKEQYVTVFNTYLTLLVNFHEDMKHAGIIPRICKKLLKVARHHGNVPNEPISSASTQYFTVNKFMAAAAEWDNCSKADSEDDMMW